MTRNCYPKVQHYVPRFILRNFSDKNDKIYVFDKKTSNKFKTNISNVAAERGFYNFGFNSYTLTFEFSLAKLEEQASKIFTDIVNKESLVCIKEQDKLILSRFLAIQFVRTLQWRHGFKNLIDELTKVNKKWNIENLNEYTEEDIKSQHMHSIYEAYGLTPYFYNKIWILFKAAKQHSFWISDNPISLQNMNDFGFRGNLGLAVRGIEIYFPFSKNLTLGLWCPSHKNNFNKLYAKYKSFYKASSVMNTQSFRDQTFFNEMRAGINEGYPISQRYENIINKNSLQVIYASRFIYSSNDDFSLAEQMIKSNPVYREGPKSKIR